MEIYTMTVCSKNVRVGSEKRSFEQSIVYFLTAYLVYLIENVVLQSRLSVRLEKLVLSIELTKENCPCTVG